MDAVRYYIALLMVVAFPAGMSMWFVIHPFARFWRRRGPGTTYVAVLSIAVAIGFVVFRFRGVLLSVEFGFSWPLALLAAAFYGAGIVVELQWRRQMSAGTLLGLPEVSEERPDVMLDQGIYGKIRHPRYLGMLCQIAGSAFLTNYLAVYALFAVSIPLLYLTVVLEERELIQRFGDRYIEYMRQVPRFIPTTRSLR